MAGGSPGAARPGASAKIGAMSYDLVARRVSRPDDVRRAAARDAPARRPDDDAWRAMGELADALQAAAPDCRRSESRAGGVIDLATPRMQVEIGSDEASIMVPYWTLGTGADGVDRAGTLAALLITRGGFTVWDPQTDEIIDPERAEQQVRDGYRMMAPAALRAIGGEARRRSRWRFWARG